MLYTNPPPKYKRRPRSLGVYIHVPWCIQKCDYCDFYSVALNPSSKEAKKDGQDNIQLEVGQEALRNYLVALEAEFHERREQFDYDFVDTIYFGGGTASLLPPESLHRILLLLKDELPLTDNVEITLESNPENLTPDYTKALWDLGFTRVNVGLQTKNKKFLTDMNRYFNPQRYYNVLKTLVESGIPNIGADLIYGFEGQNTDKFYRDLKPLLDKNIEHISIYALTAEPGTPYGNAVKAGLKKPPRERLQTQIFLRVGSYLKRMGYNYYEISNFAKSGCESRHNMRYWLYEPYLGLGPGAHGFTGRKRYGNPRNIEAWLKNPARAPLQEGKHLVDFPLGYLRFCEGLSLTLMAETFHDCGYSQITEEKLEEIYDYWLEHRLIYETPDDTFCWSPISLKLHNNRLLEMVNFLEKIA